MSVSPPLPSPDAAPAEVVRSLWAALSRRDWDAVGGHIGQGGIYIDVPVGPTAAAKGPIDVVKRLRIGLESLADYRNHEGLLVADGETVMYEHAETWTFRTGEVVELPFVSVHRVQAGRVTLWKDYWDFGTVVSAAPAGWLEGLAEADMSWMFDATGLV